MAKLGENALANMARLGLEELRSANAGEKAMDAPVVVKPSYAEASAGRRRCRKVAGKPRIRVFRDRGSHVRHPEIGHQACSG